MPSIYIVIIDFTLSHFQHGTIVNERETRAVYPVFTLNMDLTHINPLNIFNHVLLSHRLTKEKKKESSQ